LKIEIEEMRGDMHGKREKKGKSAFLFISDASTTLTHLSPTQGTHNGLFTAVSVHIDLNSKTLLKSLTTQRTESSTTVIDSAIQLPV